MSNIAQSFNVYYNLFTYNSTQANIPMKFEIQFDYPLLSKISDYKVSIVSAKVDITGNNFPATIPLDKVLFTSNSLSIIGSVYANNLANNAIMSFDFPQTSSDQLLYVQPYYPQALTMTNTTPLTRLDMNILAVLEDGSTQQMYLAPKKSFTCRLLFTRIF